MATSTATKPAGAPTKTARKAAPSARPQRSSASKSTQAPSVEKTKAPSKSVKAISAPTKDKKVKVVRDSYTIPKTEHTQLGDLKKRALGLGLAAKKSELLRAGLLLLAKQTDTQFKTSLAQVPAIKTGRPAKS